jgi:hypothetical protein
LKSKGIDYTDILAKFAAVKLKSDIIKAQEVVNKQDHEVQLTDNVDEDKLLSDRGRSDMT